jgi:hypothetical protein
MYYGQWLVDISLAMLFGGAEFSLCACKIVQTNPHPYYTVNSYRIYLTNNIMCSSIVVYMYATPIIVFKIVVFVAFLIFVSEHSSNEVCSNGWEARKLNAVESNECIYCSIKNKK